MIRKLIEDIRDCALDGVVDEHLVEAIDRALGASEWQPISTAPKDGRYLMLWCPNEITPRVAIGCWDDGVDLWMESDNRTDTDWLGPTHWMPLPEPPS